ncbi:MAG: hypothetical protein Q8N90_00235 [bacterium]|nr:hypothetical protein [bacterium]
MKIVKKAMNRYNLHLIKSRRSYSFSEIGTLLHRNRKTCHRWESGGLRVIEKNVNPLLVMGADLIDFLRRKSAKSKIHLEENEFFCCKCHGSVKAKVGSGRTIKTGKRIGKDNREQFKKIGICDVCGTKVNKFLSVGKQD